MFDSSSDDDDIYGGFNDFNELLDDAGIEDDTEFHKAVKTSYGNRVKTGSIRARATTGRIPTAAQRIATARINTGFAIGDGGGEARPMTAVGAAGFKSSIGRGETFDPTAGAAPALEKPTDESPEVAIKNLEKKIHTLVEKSAMLAEKGKMQEAIDVAKEANLNERQVSKQRELLGSDQMNYDLSFSVLLHLASLYDRAEMYSEAVNAYNIIIRDRSFDRSGRLRMNIGNIYFKQKKFLKALKMYRMAFDIVPSTYQQLRNEITKSIGHVLVRMGRYSDAASSYALVLEATPVKELDGIERKMAGSDFTTAFNCILCHFALGDKEKMRKGFLTLLSLRLDTGTDDERYLNLQNDAQIGLLLDAIKDDRLRRHELDTVHKAERCLTLAAKLISPVIEDSFAEGYDWCVESVKASPYQELAPELQITKAITFLKLKDFSQAVATLKEFEKKGNKMMAAAATNLAFLYLQENQIVQADKYCDIAMQTDRYNPHALVNKGNCLYANGEYQKSMEFYEEAIAVESSCTEALYNLGLVHKQLENYEDALDMFLKLHSMVRESAEIVYQIADTYERMDDPEAIEWYLTLVSVVPTDPTALAHLGELFDRDNDKSQAFQYHCEAFRYFPSDINIISWLGGYYVESQFCEKAIPYFRRAAEVQPNEVKWHLSVASCYRRSGNYQAALDTYKKIHKLFPENIECLKFLKRICTDLGLPEVEEYTIMLKKAEKAKALKEKRVSSGRAGSGRRIRSGRTGSGRDRRVDSAQRRGSGRTRDSTTPTAMDRQDSNHSEGSSNGIAALPRRAVDASYDDPIGQMPARPKTAARRNEPEDEWGEDDGQDLLPD